MLEKTDIQTSGVRGAVSAEVMELTEREGGLYSGHVPLRLINDKDVPVNEENLDLIGAQLDDEAEHKGTDGQIQPVMLGLVEGYDELEIIDGFHRFSKFQSTGRETIYATIIEVTYEELLDKRIQNTRNHQGLQFARATQWVREVWDLNPYAHKLTAMQAFMLGRMKGSTGKKLGLEPEDVEHVMEWVDEKSALWGVGPMTINSYLRTDETVAQDLVHNSRPDASQSTDPHALPQSTLTRIGRQIPGRDDLQRAVARVITEQKLSGTGITGILADIKGMDDLAAVEYLGTVDYAAYKEKIAAKHVYKYPEDDMLRMGRVRESSRVRPLEEVAALTGIHIDLVLNEGSYDTERLKVVRDEVAKIAQQLVEKVAIIDIRLGDDSEAPIATEEAVEYRPIEEFNDMLRTFMLNHELPFNIITDREARTAERALNRGRGTGEALALLESTLEAYYEKNEK